MEYLKIKKRDGRIVPFDAERIEKAVLKAFVAVDGELNDYAIAKAKNIAKYIQGKVAESGKEELSVEQIQDLVEKGLMSTLRKDVARAYITYRNDRNKVRAWENEMMIAAGDKLAARKIDNQNANVDEHSFGGRKGEFDAVIAKQYALDNCMSEKSKHNHIENRIYIHKLNCA